MRITAFILLLSLLSGNLMATEFQFNYKEGRGKGKVKFPVATVNGITVWSNSEKNSLINSFNQFSATRPVTVIDITPSPFEINLTTCTLNGFISGDDYLDAQTKSGIMPYLDELYIRIQTLKDSNQNAQANKLQSNYDYLSSAAKSLP